MNMNRCKWPLAAFTMVALAGCVPAMMTPTVTATPGPGKLPADFAADNTACAAQTNQQMAPVVQAANNQVANNALQNLMTGTGLDPVTAGAQATSAVQQQYDTAYAACMYARGDNVPPYYMQPTSYAGSTEPTEPTHHVKKRVAHKPSSSTPTATASNTSQASASNAGQASASGFVVPAPSSAPASGSGNASLAPVQSVSASGGFAVPPPASH
jgi:hypothetical protein